MTVLAALAALMSKARLDTSREAQLGLVLSLFCCVDNAAGAAGGPVAFRTQAKPLPPGPKSTLPGR